MIPSLDCLEQGSYMINLFDDEQIADGDQDTALPVGHALWLGQKLSAKPDIVAGARYTLPPYELREIQPKEKVPQILWNFSVWNKLPGH